LSGGSLSEKLIIYTHKLNAVDFQKIENVKFVPVLFQEYVPKEIELRMTVIEEDVFSCAIDSQKSERTKDDWRRYDFEKVPHYSYKLPVDIENKLVDFLKNAGLKFGAFDMILTPNGEYVFLEINPNGQWYWIEKLTGMKITERLVRLFKKYINSERR